MMNMQDANPKLLKLDILQALQNKSREMSEEYERVKGCTSFGDQMLMNGNIQGMLIAFDIIYNMGGEHESASKDD